MEDTFYESLWNNNTPEVADFERLEAGVQDFMDFLQEIKSSGDVQKVLERKQETIGKGENELKTEGIKKVLDEALTPINERLGAIEKEVTPEEEVKKNAETQQMEDIKSILSDAIAPITEQLDTAEKARGISKKADTDEGDKELVQKHYLSGAL